MDTARPIFVVGGGPSLYGFDFGRLRGRQVAGINRAYEVLQNPTVLWWTDVAFFVACKDKLRATGAEHYWGASVDIPKYQYPEWVTKWNLQGVRGFSEKPMCVYHGNNSGYALLHALISFGFKKIALMGYDFKWSGSKDHWHSGYYSKLSEEVLKNKMLPFFDELAEPARQRGVTILNTSQDSLLTHWPKVSIEEALDESGSCWRTE